MVELRLTFWLDSTRFLPHISLLYIPLAEDCHWNPFYKCYRNWIEYIYGNVSNKQLILFVSLSFSIGLDD